MSQPGAIQDDLIATRGGDAALAVVAWSRLPSQVLFRAMKAFVGCKVVLAVEIGRHTMGFPGGALKCGRHTVLN